MKSKDQILLEAAYQKIFEDFTGATDPNMLKPEEVAANQQETQSREDSTFNPNNIVAAFKQQGKTEVTPLEQLKDKNGYMQMLKSDYRVDLKPDSKLFLVQKQLGLGTKVLRTAQVGNSVKISKGVLEIKNDGTANFYMINDVDNQLAFNKRQILDPKSLYSVVDEFNKFAK
jgi:hypothetical protein